MKIDEALIIFYKLKSNTKDSTTSEIHSKFITILLDLQQRDPTKKVLNKNITSFEDFLTNRFSIISEDHYVSKGMTL